MTLLCIRQCHFVYFNKIKVMQYAYFVLFLDKVVKLIPTNKKHYIL